MIPTRRLSVLLLGVSLGSAPCSASAQRLVNMVPNSRSGETNQDAEPTIAIDRRSALRLAGAAFTSDNLTQGPNVTDTAPIYVSSDGGATWTLAFIVPSKAGAGFPTGDITLSFGSAPKRSPFRVTSRLYGGILSSASSPRPMVVLRSQNPFVSTVMASLDTRTGNVDQPHTTALTSGGQDRLYVGFNNGFNCLAPSGRSAMVDASQDAKVAAPALTLDVIEARNTACQDGFAQVVAAHSDGTVYAAFLHDLTSSPRLVVVRDDNWAAGATPFAALTDPSDLVAGRFVTPALTLGFGSMGQNRLGASNVSIAVDPGNSSHVYVAWGDASGSSSGTIHVRQSVNRGVDWSNDLVTITDAMNPQVAITSVGVAGLLYQRVVSGNWETRIALTNDLAAANFALPGTLLARQSASTPSATFSPYIGDYASLVADGRGFVGMFSASNFPDKANFLAGVTYQREVDWNTHTLFTDATHTTTVPPSIDPFFVAMNTSVCNRLLLFCDICRLRPSVCFPIYDPWWRLKCPMCDLTIFVNPGEEFTNVMVFDSKGNRRGVLKPLQRPLVEKGITYRYAITLKQEEGVGFLLKAGSKDREGTFAPDVLVKLNGQQR